jgi:transposase
MPVEQITAFTHIKKSRVYSLRTEAIRRGWDPQVSKVVEVHHMEDAKRSGWPKTSQVVIDLIIATVTKNSTTHGWSCSQIAYSVSETPGIQPVSASTVYRVLTTEGFSTYKRTVKPGLTKDQKDARLKWCLERKDWTLEDWKNVIWTDETRVVMGAVRGKRRVWRKKDEAYNPHVIV